MILFNSFVPLTRDIKQAILGIIALFWIASVGFPQKLSKTRDYPMSECEDSA